MEYDDCPTVCGAGEDITPGISCEDCPVKQAKENFKDNCETALENDCPETWKKYGFKSLKQTVEEIASMEDLPKSERTRLTHRLIQEFSAARARYERIQSQNSRKTE